MKMILVLRNNNRRRSYFLQGLALLAIGFFFLINEDNLRQFSSIISTSTIAVLAFTTKTTTIPHRLFSKSVSFHKTPPTSITLNADGGDGAGGFEWEDPTADGGMYSDSGVENPYKNPELMKKIKDGSSLDEISAESGATIDPARLLGPRLQGTNIYLIGMMGSGKSSIGDKLARRMGSYKYLDTDDIIERATNLKIPEIFEEEGEDGFRNVESQILDTVHSYVRCVVSTGGGLVCKTQNWAKLQTGIVIWLNVSPDDIYARISDKSSNRPLLQTDDPLQTLTDLLEERKSKYMQADFCVNVDDATMNEDTVVSRIVFDLHNYIDENPPAWKVAKERDQNLNS